MISSSDPSFEGVYGPFTIDATDRREVLGYRLSLLTVAIAQLGWLIQWHQRGMEHLWPWLVLMAVGLGLALHWIHIYLRPLHLALKLFWLLGSTAAIGLAATTGGPAGMLQAVQEQPLWLLAVGPYFAALAGIGFKEFFCFRRAEAIGVTLLLPLALLGRLLGLVSLSLCGQLLLVEAVLLLLLCLRKLPMPAAADVGDKSVFAYLEGQRRNG
ncbi:MAG: DUF2301 domain-containing membrane protein [Cyanobacteriota bacterium]